MKITIERYQELLEKERKWDELQRRIEDVNMLALHLEKKPQVQEPPYVSSTLTMLRNGW